MNKRLMAVATLYLTGLVAPTFAATSSFFSAQQDTMKQDDMKKDDMKKDDMKKDDMKKDEMKKDQ